MKGKMKRTVMAFVHIIVAYFIIIISNQISLFSYDICATEPYDIMLRYTSYMFIAILLVCIYVKVVIRKPLKKIGIGKPFVQRFWCIIALTLPISVSIIYLAFTNGNLVRLDLSDEEIIAFIIRAVFMGVSSGIVEELTFRGVIMRSIDMAWNKKMAILLPSILFAIIHMSQIETSNIGSTLMLLIGGTTIGIMFSMIAYQTGSIWSGAMVHGVWNIMIIGGILEIKPLVESYSPSIWTYVLKEKSIFLTGGNFGIETSAISIIGYIIVILITCKRVQYDRVKQHGVVS